MATYPSVNIRSLVQRERRTDYTTAASCFIYGFAARGPNNKPITVTSLTHFKDIFGAPTTDAEYTFYRAVKNTIEGYGIATCFKIPYKKQPQYNEDLKQSVTYYCDVNTLQRVDTAVAEVEAALDVDHEYLTKALQSKLKAFYKADKALTWSLTEPVDYTHKIELTCINNTRTLFDYDGTNVIVDKNAKIKSLGLVPVLIGSLNTAMITTDYFAVIEILANSLTTTIKSNIFDGDLFGADSPLANYKTLFNSDESAIYVNCLNLLTAFNANNTSDLPLAKRQLSLVVFELLLDDENRIYANILEYVTGVVDSQSILSNTNLCDNINEQSVYFNAEITATESSEAMQFTEDTQPWHYVDISSDVELTAFGLNSKAFDVSTSDAYEVELDAILNNKLTSYINSLATQTSLDNRFYDYIVAPSVIDCFTNANESGGYSLPHEFSDATLSATSFDKINANKLINMLARFTTDVDKSCVLLVDLPLASTYKIGSIIAANKSSAVNRLSLIIEHMQTIDVVPPVNHYNARSGNIMYWFNHQLVDKFERTDNMFVVIPASVEMLYVFCLADITTTVAQLAGNTTFSYLSECHGGIIPSKPLDTFKTLFNTYKINSLISDINNNVMPNQQTLVTPHATSSIFRQHHAFRLAKYLRRQIYQTAIPIKYSTDHSEAQRTLRKAVSELLARYQDNNVIENYDVICDDRNNTPSAIENHELYCSITVSIFGAITSINLTLTETSIAVDITDD